MKKLFIALLGIGVFFVIPQTAFAAESSPVASFTHDILNVLILLATLGSTVFLIKGGYTYITSTGHPDALASAKKTIRNALVGLALVIGASTTSAILSHAFSTPINPANSGAISLTPIQPATPQGGLTQVIIDAIVGVLQNIIQTATKPLVDGIISFLTTTPSVVSNSVLFNFWLVIVGITDTLFAIMIALLGFHVMSSSAFGFEDIDLKQVLSRIVIAFLGANMSIFLIDRIISLCNALIQTVLNATGGITQAWVLNAFDPASIVSGSTPIITLIFMILFVVLAIVLLLYYISRLIIISLGAVLSPLIFLLWVLPASADFARIAVKTYVVTIFTVFVHVVTIQLASSFLAVSQQTGTNSIISILTAVGMFFTLLKIPGTLAQMAFYTSMNGAFRKVGGQIMNVISTSSERTRAVADETVKTPARKVAL